MSEQIRVMIVDDHEIVRDGLRALVHREPAMALVGEAYSVESAIAEARRTQPDVVIMDVRLSDGSGVQACRDIRSEHPDIKFIMLTSYPDEEAVFASILAGASGYLLKQTRRQVLVEAILTVARGESLLDPAVTNKVLDSVRTGMSKQDDEMAQISPQEQRILNLIAQGKTNKEIAAELKLSHKTVKNYVSGILSKMSFRRRSEAAAFIARRTATRI
jgi:DNA-binding NarL/FixJ family response regulator